MPRTCPRVLEPHVTDELGRASRSRVVSQRFAPLSCARQSRCRHGQSRLDQTREREEGERLQRASSLAARTLTAPQKAKLKVGKAKQPAANATNTSVKVKRVSLPSQTVGRGSLEEGAEASTSAGPTTKRRLGLDDLVGQLGHYSVHVRKGALAIR